MSRHAPPPQDTTWDLFAPARSEDGLRSIALLANQLAASPTQRVRLFVDDPGRLGSLSARVDPSLWVQPLGNHDLMRLRLADAVAPANHAICLGNTALPVRYRERMAYGAGNRCKLLRIWPPGHTHESIPASTPAEACTSLRIDVVQDTKTEGIGLIKDARNMAEMRTRWKSHPNLAQTTLQGLGLAGDLARGTLIVCCWGAALADLQAFVNTLDQGSGQPVLLLMGPTPGMETPPAPPPPQGLVRCLRLPALSWSQCDELIWSSDLLLCGQRDMALRAMESGTPLMWLPPATASVSDDDTMLDWYFDDLDPGFKRCLLATAHSLRENAPASQELVWYLKQRDDLELIARQVAQRIAQARNLADNLPCLSPALMEQAKRRKQQLNNTHPPTWPMSLPGPPKSA